MSENTDETEASLLMAMSVDDTKVLPDDYIASAGSSLPENKEKAQKEDIIAALKTVSDPEIMINIYDLGLVYKIEQQENGDVNIEMTLTAPTCPVAGVLPQQAADAVAKVDGTGRVEVKVVWEPAWSFEKLSQDAKDMLEML